MGGAWLPRTLSRRGPSVPRGGGTRLCRVPCSTGVRSTWRQGWSTSRWCRRSSPGWSVCGVARCGGPGVSMPPSHRLVSALPACAGAGPRGVPSAVYPPTVHRRRPSQASGARRSRERPAGVLPASAGGAVARHPVQRSPACVSDVRRGCGHHAARRTPELARLPRAQGSGPQRQPAPPGQACLQRAQGSGPCVCPGGRAGAGATGPAGTREAGSRGRSGAEQGLAGDWQ